MADGKTHSKFGKATIVLSGATAGLIVTYFNNQELAGGIVIGSILGWLMPPDLDLQQRTYDEHRMLQLNPFLGMAWIGFWASYGQVFKHRGISHMPIVGTATRIVWLFRHVIVYIGVTAILIATGVLSLTKEINVPSISLNILIGIFIGWAFQDFVHLSLDGVLFGISRPKRKFAKEKNKIYTVVLLLICFLMVLAAYTLVRS